MATKIEWCQETWNPITGCTKISAGCAHCYAERMAKRLAGRYGYPADDPFRVTFHPDRLSQPSKWKKPRLVFVCSMGDLFHEDVPFEQINQVVDRASRYRGKRPGHKYLFLTKRPERVLAWRQWVLDTQCHVSHLAWFQSKAWMGVTAENQEMADQRIPTLLQIPAAVRFVSVEPMLGAVTLNYLHHNNEVEIDALNGTHGVLRPHQGENAKLDWVICGGESGPGARPMHPEWASGLRDQCQAAGVPFFFKQQGCWETVYDRDKDDPDWRRCDTIKNQTPKGQWLNLSGGQGFHGYRVVRVVPTSKKKAGRQLDGREWNEYPEVNRCQH